MKRVLLGLVLIILSLNSWAVDGYKSLKFGNTIKQLIDSKICTFKKVSVKNQLTTYACDDFKFGEQNTIGMAAFINDKFKRLVINIDGPLEPLIESLNKKYGLPSSMSDEEAIKNYDQTGKPVFIRYDKDTIIAQTQFDGGKIITMLIYTVPDYDAEARKAMLGSIDKDI